MGEIVQFPTPRYTKAEFAKKDPVWVEALLMLYSRRIRELRERRLQKLREVE